MKPLENLVLVGLYVPVQKTDFGAVPATFKGKATLDPNREVTFAIPTSG
jgi:hypothetical protein